MVEGVYCLREAFPPEQVTIEDEVELKDLHSFGAYKSTLVGNPAAGQTPLVYVSREMIDEPEGVEYVTPETHLLDTEFAPSGKQPDGGALVTLFPVEVAVPVQSELVKYETDAGAEVAYVLATLPQLI